MFIFQKLQNGQFTFFNRQFTFFKKLWICWDIFFCSTFLNLLNVVVVVLLTNVLSTLNLQNDIRFMLLLLLLLFCSVNERSFDTGTPKWYTLLIEQWLRSISKLSCYLPICLRQNSNLPVPFKKTQKIIIIWQYDKFKTTFVNFKK